MLLLIFLLISPSFPLHLIKSSPAYHSIHFPLLAIIYVADYCCCLFMIKYCNKMNESFKYFFPLLMSEAGILPCLYDTRPPVNSSKRKQSQPAYKTCCPPHIQVFMGIKTTGFKSDLERDEGEFGLLRSHAASSVHPLMSLFGLIYFTECKNLDFISTQEDNI